MATTVRNVGRIRRILVLGRSHIGDCLLTTPALRALRRRFPDARLDVAIPRSNEDLLVANPHLDDLVFRPSREDWVAKLAYVAAIRRRHYDLLVSFQEKSLFYGWVARFSNAPRRVGLDHPRTRPCFTENVPVRQRVHEVEKYLAVAEALGCDVEDRTLELAVPARARRAVGRILREEEIDLEARFIGINPGATTGDKRWPVDRFAAVAESLSERMGLPVLLFGGPGDVGLAEAVARRMSRRPLILAGRVSLGETAAFLERCRLFVTSDTGPMHMAAALAVPVVAVFGPTSPVKFGPYSALGAVVREENPCPRCERPCVHAVTVERVLASCLTQAAILPPFPEPVLR